MVYTDKVHVVADSLAELHEWAAANGIKPCWFHRGRLLHYDLPKRIRGKVPPGAVEVSSKKIVEVARTAK